MSIVDICQHGSNYKHTQTAHLANRFANYRNCPSASQRGWRRVEHANRWICNHLAWSWSSTLDAVHPFTPQDIGTSLVWSQWLRMLTRPLICLFVYCNCVHSTFNVDWKWLASRQWSSNPCPSVNSLLIGPVSLQVSRVSLVLHANNQCSLSDVPRVDQVHKW